MSPGDRNYSLIVKTIIVIKEILTKITEAFLKIQFFDSLLILVETKFIDQLFDMLTNEFNVIPPNNNKQTKLRYFHKQSLNFYLEF